MFRAGSIGERVVTAIGFGVILLGPILWGALPGLMILGVAAVLSIWEYLGIQQMAGRSRILAASMALLMYLFLAWQVYDEGVTVATQYAIYLGAFFALLLLLRFVQRQDPFDFGFQVVPAALYIGLPLAMLYISAYWDGTYQPVIILIILSFIWINDIAAFFVGRSVGRRPFFAHVSPKKTWEGAVAGWMSCGLLAWIYWSWLDSLGLSQWILLGTSIGLAGSFGDLIESSFKRHRNLKDSGRALPGHGGLLDRLDALLFVMPFVMLYFLVWRP